MQERLQKILSRAGFASRRGAEQLMLDGRVTVDGEVVRELGAKADVETDDVRVDGVRVKAPRAFVYLVLNKPRGVVTTRSDPENRPTVMGLVPAVAGLFPVGRLDVTTEGLILLTNDGAFAERVSHPRYEVPRVYHAKVTGVPGEHALERLRRGVRVDADLMAVDRVRVLEADNNAWVEVTLHEGKQHEVRRLLEAVGHPVSKLRRVAFGPVTTKGLEPGQFRSLTPEEIDGLRKGIGARVSPSRIAIRRRPRPKPPAKPQPARGRDGQGERRRPRRFEDRGQRPFSEGRNRRSGDDQRQPTDSGERRLEGRGERRIEARGEHRFGDRTRGGLGKGGERRFGGGQERGVDAKRGRSSGAEQSFGGRGRRGSRGQRPPETGSQRPPGPRRGGRPPGPRRGRR